MASILSVEQLQGLAAGSTPNTITIPSGQTLHAPGHVIQTVYHETTSQVAGGSSTGSYFDCGMALNITPKFATSKILVNVTMRLFTQPGCNAIVRTRRDTTNIHAIARYGLSDNEGSVGDGEYYVCHVLDSPATTSQISYNVQVGRQSGGNNWYVSLDSDKSTIVLQEIAQ
jgi:hypothetical protein